MLISISHWLLLVEGVADSIDLLSHPLGICLQANDSFLQTPALPFLALGASGPTFGKLHPPWLFSYNYGCEFVDKYSAPSPLHCKGFKDGVSASGQSGNSAKCPSQMLTCTPLSPHNTLTDPPFFLITLSTFFPCLRSWNLIPLPSYPPAPRKIPCHLPRIPVVLPLAFSHSPSFLPAPLFFWAFSFWVSLLPRTKDLNI